MLIRCGLLFIANSTDSANADAVLAEVQGMLGGALDRILPLASRVYAAPHRYQIEETLRHWCDEEEIDLIVTVGGTFPAPGPSADEIVPEATAAVLERMMPSLSETMRARAAATNPMALLDRGVAGIRGRTLIVNLPGQEALTATFLESILDVIPSVTARLGTEEEVTIVEEAPIAREPETAPPRAGALDSEEFAAFLRRRQKDG